MKPVELVEELYQEHLVGAIGPRSVGDLKKAMISAAKKSPRPKYAAVKAAAIFLDERGKKAPKKLLALMPGGASVVKASKNKEKEPTVIKKSVKPVKKAAKVVEKTSSKSESGTSDKVKELQGKILKQPGIATLSPANMDKVALRTVLKQNGIEYAKEDKESVLREKLIIVLKRIALPVLDFNKANLDITKNEKGESDCYGVLIDVANAKECQICPVQVECRTTFKANIADASWLKKALGGDATEAPETRKRKRKRKRQRRPSLPRR